MILLDRNFLLKSSREKSLEELTIWDFRIDQWAVHSSRLVAFLDNKLVKIFRNYNAKVGVITYSEFKELLKEKIESYEGN